MEYSFYIKLLYFDLNNLIFFIIDIIPNFIKINNYNYE